MNLVTSRVNTRYVAYGDIKVNYRIAKKIYRSKRASAYSRRKRWLASRYYSNHNSLFSNKCYKLFYRTISHVERNSILDSIKFFSNGWNKLKIKIELDVLKSKEESGLGYKAAEEKIPKFEGLLYDTFRDILYEFEFYARRWSKYRLEKIDEQVKYLEWMIS